MAKNPFHYLRPVPIENFVGRWPLVREISADLVSERGESHALIAGKRCGKSSVLKAISYQLREMESIDAGDWVPLIIPFSFKRSGLISEGGCLAEIFQEVVQRVDASVFRRPKDAWSEPIALEHPKFVELKSLSALSLQNFENGIGYILDLLSSPDQPVRLVLLLDEMDEPLDYPWADKLFNHLRALIYSSDLAEQVRLVITGSHKILKAKELGSPLMNAVQEHYLAALEKDSIMDLSDKARLFWSDGLPEEVVEEVWLQCGGQPFIAQYLLHFICNKTDPTKCNKEDVRLLAANFGYNRLMDIEGWVSAIGVDGLLAYGALAKHSAWVKENELIASIQNAKFNINRGLNALCYHGLAVHDDGWVNCRYSGDLFKKWFQQNGEAYLKQEAEKHPEFQGAEIISEMVLLLNGPLKFEQIDTQINTGGGTYAAGNINTEGGDFVGRDRLTDSE